MDWPHDPPHYEAWQMMRCPTCGNQSPPYEWYCYCKEDDEPHDPTAEE